MRVRVLKELPTGAEPGAVIDIPDHHVEVLVLVGAVEVLDGSDEAAAVAVAAEPASRRGRYRRRDMVAEGDE